MDIKLANVVQLVDELEERCFACAVGAQYFRDGDTSADMVITTKGDSNELIMMGFMLEQWLAQNPEAAGRFSKTTMTQFIAEMNEISKAAGGFDVRAGEE